MEVCMLDLGSNPWAKLDSRRVNGTMRWGDRPEVGVSVKVRGAHSRRFPKRSLEVRIAGRNLLDEPPANHTIELVHFNADYVDPTLLRSALSYLLFHEVGAAAPLCRHIALSVSDRFAGVYVALESVDKDFCSRRGWRPGPIYYAVTRDANFGLASPFSRRLKMSLDEGYQDLWGHGTDALKQLIKEINLASEAELHDVLERWFDVEAYLRWLMVAVFVGNRDGFVHNYALYHDQESARFRIVPWDYDATFGVDINGRPAGVGRVPVTGWNKLSHRLLSLPPYRQRYRQAFLEALESCFSMRFLAEQVERIGGAIQPWVEKDRRRSGARKPYQEHLNRLLQWTGQRRDHLAVELKAL